MKKISLLFAILFTSASIAGAQEVQTPKEDHIIDGLTSVATIAGQTKTVEEVQDTTAVAKPIPLWKQKLYYGYNFDIYYHHDSRPNRKENGWSIRLIPEIGWKLKERLYIGLRVGGSYQDMYTTYTYESLLGEKETEEIRVQQGSWDVAPYVRFRLKTLFNDKVTYQFSKKSTFQIFFSIISLGYSGTTFRYQDPLTGERHNEYTNDVIIFSGKLRNLIANQFTPGLYGLKFGVMKTF